MSYVVTGLPVEPFAPLFGLPDEALAARGVLRRRVDRTPGFPCRVTLQDALPGETVLLLNFEHQSADTAFRSRHAIYVRETAAQTARAVGAAPEALAVRTWLSVRAFDAAGMLLDAEVVPGAALEPAVERLLLARGDVAYLHVHSAGMGCYLARVDRA